MKQIGAGAEAVIYLDNDTVVKDRIAKGYRIKEIDNRLRKARTKREAKVLEKLRAINFPGPRLIDSDDRDMKIRMRFVKGTKLRDVIQKDPAGSAAEIGKKVAILHNNGLIHGDLTTSNMILGDEIYFIDFGLSFFSEKAEDKAVDIHLFRQAVESKHHTYYDAIYPAFLEGYKGASDDYDPILERMKKVEARGRYAHRGNIKKSL